MRDGRHLHRLPKALLFRFQLRRDAGRTGGSRTKAKSHVGHKSVNQMTSPMAPKLHGKGAYERLPRSATLKVTPDL